MDPQLSDELSFIMTFLSTVLRREQTDEKVTLPFFFLIIQVAPFSWSMVKKMEGMLAFSSHCSYFSSKAINTCQFDNMYQNLIY